MLRKFTKISNKIFLGYAIFIVIIIVQLLLTYSVNNQADQSFTELTDEIKPKLELLNKFRNANRVLFLLINNKVSSEKNTINNNKIKQISEVDFPYFIENLIHQRDNFFENSFYTQNIDTIIVKALRFEDNVDKINRLLFTSRDYKDEEKISKSKEILDELAETSASIDYSLALLQKELNNKSEESFFSLTEIFDNSKVTLLISTLFLIVLGLLFSLYITSTITKPVQGLIDGAKKITQGDYSAKTKVIGNDEIAELTRIFNKMSRTLEVNFNDINNKNRELEQFTYIASHDLQEPLKTLTGFVNLLSENYGDKFDEVGQQSLTYISAASDRMSLLVKSLLDYNRIGKQSSLTRLNCKKIVNYAIEDLAASIKEKNVVIKINELPSLVAYPVELRLLFQNLISNAIKFTNHDSIPKIEISAIEKEGWTFSIKDNGVGFEQKHAEEIFKVFKRLNYKTKAIGTGIGLAHCKKIVELHKGKIWVESTPNKGSTFYFNIPKIKS